MKVEEIPSDMVVVMTEEMHRVFRTTGCKPMCHLTFEPINVGDRFKLATVNEAVRIGSGNYSSIESREVMLSEDASVEEYNNRSEQRIKDEDDRRKRGGGCFRINGKIVH